MYATIAYVVLLLVFPEYAAVTTILIMAYVMVFYKNEIVPKDFVYYFVFTIVIVLFAVFAHFLPYVVAAIVGGHTVYQFVFNNYKLGN